MFLILNDSSLSHEHVLDCIIAQDVYLVQLVHLVSTMLPIASSALQELTTQTSIIQAASRVLLVLKTIHIYIYIYIP